MPDKLVSQASTKNNPYIRKIAKEKKIGKNITFHYLCNGYNYLFWKI